MTQKSFIPSEEDKQTKWFQVHLLFGKNNVINRDRQDIHTKKTDLKLKKMEC
jgi:hypothetical protein